MQNYDAIVIGGGAAGMSAAIKLDEKNKRVLLIETSEMLGGVLNQCIHSGFGIEYYDEDLTGPTFANRLANDLQSTNVEIKLSSHVTNVTKDKEVEYTNKEGCYRVKSKAIVFAVGSLERTAGAISLPGKRLKGIHTAGSAQQYINMEGHLVGKNIFILGSGDIGLIMARRMQLEGANVLGVAEMMPYSNGLARNIAQCLEDYDIPLFLSHVVTNCIGTDNLEKIEISAIDEKFQPIQGTEKIYEVDTLLLAVGLMPVTNLYNMLDLTLDKKTRSIQVDSNYQSSEPGIFSCGNCLHIHDIVDFVAQEGEFAGEYCNKYLEGNLVENKELIEVETNENITYTIPKYLDLKNNLEQISIFFRVNKIYKKATIIILYDGKEVKRKKKQILLPAEMEKIVINQNELDFKKIKIVVEGLQ